MISMKKKIVHRMKSYLMGLLEEFRLIKDTFYILWLSFMNKKYI